MSIIRSDNFFFTNPKPPQEYERRYTGSTYVDWADTTELNAALDVQFRKNKYFWIAGVYYECDDDGVTYRAIGGPTAPVPNLQQVTDAGNLTSTPFGTTDAGDQNTAIGNGGRIGFLGTLDPDTNDYGNLRPGELLLGTDDSPHIDFGKGFVTRVTVESATGNNDVVIQDGSGTLAFLTDVGDGIKVAFAAPVTTANTITVAALATASTLIMVVMDKIVFNAAVDDGNQVSFSGTTLDMTNAGGVTAGGWLIIFYL